MRTIIRQLFVCALLFCSIAYSNAQQISNSNKVEVVPSVEFFIPHWQLDMQLGGACDLGEADFVDLLSPAFQVSATYQFIPAFGVRMGASGLWARNWYERPVVDYKWNFVQPALDFKVDILSLFGGWKPRRTANLYAFLGAGAAYTYNNDDAVKASTDPDVHFRKLWRDHRWNFVVRGGLGTDIRISDHLTLTAEMNANLLPDHFNSKEGENDNMDWHFNALVGLKVNLGKTYGRTTPVYREIQQSAPVQSTQPTMMTEESNGLTVNIFFDLNKSELRPSENEKLVLLAIYLHEHPTSKVALTGYADKQTGNSTINEQLSRNRAQAVADFLVGRGIDSSRISKDAKGDRVQPFDIPEQNRVTISIVTDK